MNLPSDWYGVAGILIINVGIWMQSRRNGSTAKDAASAAKDVGTQVSDIQGAVNDVQSQVTNGGTNLAHVVGQINRRTELMETYFENLPNQQDIAGLRGDVRLLSSRVEKLEARDRHHHPDVQP